MKLHHLNIIHVKGPFLVAGFVKPNWFTPNMAAVFKGKKMTVVSQWWLDTRLSLKISFHQIRVFLV